ncbi:MAG: hypothetical protein WAW90_01775, partial [Minisyncoccia bacterium]
MSEKPPEKKKVSPAEDFSKTSIELALIEANAKKNRISSVVDPLFENPFFAGKKESYDPLYELMKKVATDPECPQDLRFIFPRYKVVIPGDKKSSAQQKIVETYHDALVTRAQLPEKFRKEIDEKGFVQGNLGKGSVEKWGKIEIIAHPDLLALLADQNNSLSKKYKKEFDFILHGVMNEQLPDEYAEMVRKESASLVLESLDAPQLPTPKEVGGKGRIKSSKSKDIHPSSGAKEIIPEPQSDIIAELRFEGSKYVQMINEIKKLYPDESKIPKELRKNIKDAENGLI